MMKNKLGIVMDPIQTIQFKKDSTLALLWEAQRRDWEIYYFEPKDLFLLDGKAHGHSHSLKVFKDATHWFELTNKKRIPLSDLNVILMRKDPPFNIEYIYLTYILEQAEHAGVLVVNKPQSLRDANEKLFTSWFPQCCPPTLVTRDILLLREFFAEQQDIICKPLHSMGGDSIFRLTYPDLNASVVFETLTQKNTTHMMAQRFIPDIRQGDKRILLIDGEPVPYALARIPATHELRGNLAAGAQAETRELTARDRWICEQVGPVLRNKGLFFVGLDVIGDYLTEINVTSPTGIREIDEQQHQNISSQFFNKLTAYMK